MSYFAVFKGCFVWIKILKTKLIFLPHGGRATSCKHNSDSLTGKNVENQSDIYTSSRRGHLCCVYLINVSQIFTLYHFLIFTTMSLEKYVSLAAKCITMLTSLWLTLWVNVAIVVNQSKVTGYWTIKMSYEALKCLAKLSWMIFFFYVCSSS